MHTTDERTYTTRGVDTVPRRKRLLPVIISALVGFLVGWGLGDVGDSGVDHGLPGGPATDNVEGRSPSDR